MTQTISLFKRMVTFLENQKKWIKKKTLLSLALKNKYDSKDIEKLFQDLDRAPNVACCIIDGYVRYRFVPLSPEALKAGYEDLAWFDALPDDDPSEWNQMIAAAHQKAPKEKIDDTKTIVKKTLVGTYTETITTKKVKGPKGRMVTERQATARLDP